LKEAFPPQRPALYANFDGLKSALKCDCFDVTIGIKIYFFTVSVTIEPGRS